MAKKKAASHGAQNVSQEIRNTWDADRSLKPVALVEQLGAKGIKTNPGTVSTILSQYRKKLGLASLRGKQKRGRRAQVAGSETRNGSRSQTAENGSLNSGSSVASVIEAFKLVTKARELIGPAGLRELVKAI